MPDSQPSAESYEELKEQYKRDIPTIPQIYRHPLQHPFAAIGMTAIFSVFIFTAYDTAMSQSPTAGFLVLFAAYASYRIARIGWKIENDHMAAELAKRDLEEL